jgi:hypothetical protein
MHNNKRIYLLKAYKKAAYYLLRFNKNCFKLLKLINQAGDKYTAIITFTYHDLELASHYLNKTVRNNSNRIKIT